MDLYQANNDIGWFECVRKILPSNIINFLKSILNLDQN